MLVAGVAGRRSGALALFAVIGMMAAAGTTAAPDRLSQPWEVGERTYTVTNLATEHAFQLGLGQMNIDLSRSDYSTTRGVDTVTATLGVGELDLVVPEGAKVVVNAKARAGEIVATGAGVSGQGMRERGPDQLQHEGANWEQRVSLGPATRDVDIVVNAEVGLASIRITTASAS